MNKDQGTGVIERVLYGAILFIVLKYGARFGFSSDDAAWIAGGGVGLFGGIYAWLHNRPAAVLSRAGEAVPKNAELMIVTTPAATVMEKIEAHALAKAASDKVVAKTT